MSGPYFPNLPPLLLLVPAVAVYLLLLTWTYRRGSQGIRPSVVRALVAARWLIVALVVLCLCDPVWREYRTRKQRGLVAVLADDSQSMTLQDGPGASARLTGLKQAIFDQGGLVDRLEEKRRVRAYRFASKVRVLRKPDELKGEGTTTDLAGAIMETVRNLGPEGLRAVVLCTDGAHNASSELSPVAEVLRRAGVALFAVGFGRTAGHKDIEILRVSTERRVTLDTEVTATLTLRSNGFDGEKTTVMLKRGGVTHKREVALVDGVQRVPLRFKTKDQGLLQYELEIPPRPDEFMTENNRQTFAVNCFARKLHVLYMEGTQYRIPERRLWEFQYLVQALEEDKDILVTPLLRDDSAAARRAGVATVRSAEDGFPGTRRELWEYDVIVCSDVDIEYFTKEQIENTVDFVERHGGGYCMIGGYTAFGTGGYDESPIDKMLPVDMQGRQDGYTENVPFRWRVTEEGRHHPIMQLVEDPEKNREIWDKMPMLRGFNHVQRAKPAATVLAEHPERRTLYGPNVLLAVQRYGRGRTMAFVSDSTAGWGLDFEEQWGEGGDNRYFRKFWQNAVRWLAAYRLKVPRSLVLVSSDRTVYEPGEDVTLSAQAWNKQCEPTAAAALWVELSRPGKTQVERIKLTPDMADPGRYGASFTADETGVYEARVESLMDGEKLGEDVATFVAKPSDREMRDYALHDGLLRRLAERTGGEYFAGPDAGRVASLLDETLHSAQAYVTRPAWANAWVLALLVVLLGLEWFFRRRVGLP